MIQPNELRNGNKLLFLGDIVTFKNITEIREDGIFWIKTFEQKIESKNFHFKPIPLTEEILLKCGFEKNINGLYFIAICDFYNLELMRIGSEYCSYHTKKNNDEAHSFKRIPYLHQLQNLYFALTGEELTVNL